MNDITYMTGDATWPVGEGPKIIAHVANNLGRWGAGFTAALDKRWPRVGKDYQYWFTETHAHLAPPRDQGMLGAVRYTTFRYPEEPESTWVAHMVAQDKLPSSRNTRPLRYDALGACLMDVGIFAGMVKASVHMPRIGCGLARGDWMYVEPLIRDALCRQGVEVFVYDLEVS